MEEDDKLSKLVETGDFITSGYHFYLFKDNFRAFLHSEPPSVHPMIRTCTESSASELSVNSSLNLNYDINSTIGLTSALWDICKRCIEYVAGSKLSWWPLAGPEDVLKADYVRVYSMKFVSKPPSLHYETPTQDRSQRDSRFFDDIPRSLANSLFPNLGAASSRKSAFTPKFLRREAVFLHDTTLMRILNLFAQRDKMRARDTGMSKPKSQPRKQISHAGRWIG